MRDNDFMTHGRAKVAAQKKLTGRANLLKVRKTLSWPRRWTNFSLLSLHSHRNAWANLHRLGQPKSFLTLKSAPPEWNETNYIVHDIQALEVHAGLGEAVRKDGTFSRGR